MRRERPEDGFRRPDGALSAHRSVWPAPFATPERASVPGLRQKPVAANAIRGKEYDSRATLFVFPDSRSPP